MWALNFLRSAVKARTEFESSQHNQIRLSDLVGCDEAKSELQQILEFLKNPDKFKRLGAKIPKGVLLVGPPGTGKTLMAKAVAGEAGIPFISMAGSDFSSEYAGVGTSMVKRLFARARRLGRCIIFIDEVDTIGRRRSGKDSALAMDSESTLNQLLVEIDGFDSKSNRRGLFRRKKGNILILAGTNRPDMLDPALVRAGRFDRIVNVDPPDVMGRRELFHKYLTPLPLADLPAVAVTETSKSNHPLALKFEGSPMAGLIEAALPWLQSMPHQRDASESPSADSTIERTAASSIEDGAEDAGDTALMTAPEARAQFSRLLAEMTPGFTGAQVANLCNEAALRAAAQGAAVVNMTHFSDAFDRIVGGLERSKVIPKEDLRRTAVHEAGHAIAAWFLEHSEPPLKVSVVWRGDTLGFTQTKSFERTGKTAAVFYDEMAVLLAGRIAEELVFGDASTGASHDLQRVTDIAYYLVGQVGFSGKVGPLALRESRRGDGVGISEATAQLMDQEARVLVLKAYKRARKLLKSKYWKLETMAADLIQHEVILESRISEILGPRPAKAMATAAAYDPTLRAPVATGSKTLPCPPPAALDADSPPSAPSVPPMTGDADLVAPASVEVLARKDKSSGKQESPPSAKWRAAALWGACGLMLAKLL